MTTVGGALISVARARLGTHLRTTQDCSHSLSSSAEELPEEQIIQTILKLGRTIVLVLKLNQVPRLVGRLNNRALATPAVIIVTRFCLAFDLLLLKTHKSTNPPHKCTGTPS